LASLQTGNYKNFQNLVKTNSKTANENFLKSNDFRVQKSGSKQQQKLLLLLLKRNVTECGGKKREQEQEQKSRMFVEQKNSGKSNQFRVQKSRSKQTPETSLESKSQDQNSSRKTTTTEKDSKEFEKHNNNNKVANVLENKAGSFPLSFFFSLFFHQELQKKKRKGASACEQQHERERERAMEWNFRRRSIRSPFFLLAKFKNQVILEFSNSQK